MSFPVDDPNWLDTAAFVERHRRPGEAVLAHDLFWWRFERIYRYRNTHLRPEQGYDWAILHKGELAELAPAFLDGLARFMRPVFANDVFAVWTRRRDLAALARFDRRLRAFRAARRRPPPRHAAGPPGDWVLPDPGAIAQFRFMAPAELRRAMDAFFRNGGYRYETLRDKAYFAELDRAVGGMLGADAATRALDVACGDGRVAALLPACAAYVGVDLSPVAVAMARARWAGRPECRFAAMDAEALAFPDAAFDLVTFVDAAEHVLDIEAALAQCARVLRPGGRLVATGANRNSLNQVVARKLGFGEFVTNYQHVREFALDEFERLLAAQGLAVGERAGVLLYPYWGVPKIDAVLRHVTDDDPEFVALMRELGAAVGPRHAYTFVLAAEKTG